MSQKFVRQLGTIHYRGMIQLGRRSISRSSLNNFILIHIDEDFYNYCYLYIRQIRLTFSLPL